MDDKHAILEQYRIYNESKDKFIDRNFVVNRFYLIISLILVIIVSTGKAFSTVPSSMTLLILSIVGIAIAALWWLNQDAYSLLIKVKYAYVLEKLEESLPCSPNNMEFKALAELQKNRKAFLFSDIQKLLALLSLLCFMVYAIMEIIPFIIIRPVG